MRKRGIYAIRNIANGKFYIGSASYLNARWCGHLRDLKLNNNSRYLQRAWNKYGKENFEFLFIENVKDKEKLLEREQWWIDITQSYKSEIGYNLSPTAYSSLGVKHTEETKLNMSKAKIGKSLSEEHKKKLSISAIGKNKGIKRSIETLEKMRQNRLGKTLSEETKAKISAKNSLRIVSEQEKLDKRKFNKWPCSDGSRCKCEECNKKKAAYLRNRRVCKTTPRKYFKIIGVPLNV